MSYVLIGSIFGRYWKYLVVTSVASTVMGYLIFLWTGNETLGRYSATALFFITFIIVFYMGSKTQRREEEYYADQTRRREELASSLAVDANKCMSCTTPLEGRKICPKCGYENK